MDNPLDLSDEIESRASATHHFFEYVIAFSKKNAQALGRILKRLIPSLAGDVRFELDGEVYGATNFNPDDVIRMHAALLEDKVRSTQAFNGDTSTETTARGKRTKNAKKRVRMKTRVPAARALNAKTKSATSVRTKKAKRSKKSDR